MKKYILVAIVISLVLGVIGSFLKLYSHPEIAKTILIAGIISYFVSIIFVILDLYRIDSKSKVFWILSLFLLPAISPLLYLLLPAAPVTTWQRQ